MRRPRILEEQPLPPGDSSLFQRISQLKLIPDGCELSAKRGVALVARETQKSGEMEERLIIFPTQKINPQQAKEFRLNACPERTSSSSWRLTSFPKDRTMSPRAGTGKRRAVQDAPFKALRLPEIEIVGRRSYSQTFEVTYTRVDICRVINEIAADLADRLLCDIA